MIKLLDHAHLSKLRMMFYEVERLLDYLIDVGGVLFGLPPVRKLKQAVGYGFAPESLVADDLQILAEIFVDGRVFNLVHASVEGFRAGGDGCERVIDFVDNASREPSNRSELFRMDDGFVHLLLFGHVFAHGYDVRDLGIVHAHGNLADLPDFSLALVPRFLFHSHYIAGAKNIYELMFEQPARLARQNLEHIFAKHFL